MAKVWEAKVSAARTVRTQRLVLPNIGKYYCNRRLIVWPRTSFFFVLGLPFKCGGCGKRKSW